MTLLLRYSQDMNAYALSLNKSHKTQLGIGLVLLLALSLFSFSKLINYQTQTKVSAQSVTPVQNPSYGTPSASVYGTIYVTKGPSGRPCTLANKCLAPYVGQIDAWDQDNKKIINTATTTNAGYYIMNLTVGSYNFRARQVIYSSFVLPVRVYPFRDNRLDIVIPMHTGR